VTLSAPLFPRWERDTRYYELRLQQDLWGDWVLMRVWGQRGAALGQIRHELCADYGHGQRIYAQSIIQRGKRGYVQVAGAR